tara:strand:- start:1057 stop:1356 length:300 start_codon:yes stop_codon:yes gene_type:complete
MTTETKFTQGKWSQSHREQSDGMYITQVYDDKGQSICDLNWHSVDTALGFKTDREENALLIAAAPEMYALLESLKVKLGLNGLCGDDIEKLLAKARGDL